MDKIIEKVRIVVFLNPKKIFVALLIKLIWLDAISYGKSYLGNDNELMIMFSFTFDFSSTLHFVPGHV